MIPTNMHKLLIVSVLIVALAVLDVTCTESMLTPPERPEEFKNPAELRRYLKALNEYYAIVGRPRFGKRNGGSRLNDIIRPNGDDWDYNSASWGDF
ncbi:pro-neuropeptide Y-like isoform X2 [Physella acuta]|uniref:pro-neuropeptide Y-like isoform X2 n=1 Tax=Physella acuta TaxID=109671 RepID=UPI0027DCE373|nr:pro-neuropeptide Y-like isoform X2 [Physella acuta]